MKKSVLIIVIIAAAISFALGIVCSKLISKDSEKEPGDVSAHANNGAVSPEAEDKEMPKTESSKTPKNVFYSPFTGSDSNDGLSIGTPVKTLEKAKEIGEGLTLGDNEELVILEYLMTVNVKTMQAYGVGSDKMSINMIPFTGSAEGHWFTGEIVGQGCDTQKYPAGGGAMFSARYLLKGKDVDGNSCSVFVENNGPALDLCTPTVITDSKALADWQDWELRAIVVPVAGGVDVNVFRIE